MDKMLPASILDVHTGAIIFTATMNPRLRTFGSLALAVMLTAQSGVIAAAAQPSQPPASQRAIPDDNLAYPVLITIGNSTGSGFYLNNGKEIYLVTAKHVLFNPSNNQLFAAKAQVLSYSKDPADDTRNLLTLDLAALNAAGNIKPHPSADVAVVRIFKIAPPGMTPAGNTLSHGNMATLPGVTIETSAKGGFLSASVDETVKPFDKVLVGNDVIVFGYPVSIGLQNIPQFDKLRPLLRKGIVAGSDPARHSIVLDCPAYPGNSGGPVLELDRDGFLTTHLAIIGVVDQYVPFVEAVGTTPVFANSGYSIAVPMDPVLELVKPVG